MKIKSGIFSLLCSVLLLMLASCSKDNDSVARELMATVPSNAASVMLFDGEQMVEKAGGAKNVMDVLGNNVNAEAAGLMKMVSEVWTPTAVVMFMDGDNTYLTTRVDKPADLIAAVEKRQGSKLAVDGDITYNGHIAVMGDQVWVAAGRGSLAATAIKKYVDFSENQSFASVKYCDEMIESKDDITGLFNLGSLINMAAGGFTKAAGTQMALSTLFENASFATLNADFKKGEADMQVKVLTSKFKPAKFLIPVSKVNVDVVKKVAPQASTLMAINIDSKIVNKIADAAKSFGGALPEEWLRIIVPVDGTIVLAGEPQGAAVRGIITTNGQSTLALAQFLSGLNWQTSTDGNELMFGNNLPFDGKINVAAEADRFKGAWAGLVASGQSFSPMQEVLDNCSMMIYPYDGSIRMDVKMDFIDKKSNALLQLMKNANKMTKAQ